MSMMKKTKLATKIGIGFGVVIVIAGILGVVGWRGMASVGTVVKLNAQGQACIESLDECASLRRDFALRGFEKYGDNNKTAAENWQAAYDSLAKTLEQLAASPDLQAKDKATVTQATRQMPAYLASFEHQKEARTMKDQAFSVWSKTGWDVTQEVAAVITGVIEPSRKAAEQSKDLNEVTRWSTVGTKLDESVFQEFLILRINAVYLLCTNKDEQWTNYEKQLAKLKTNLDGWSALVKGESRLETVAQNITGFIKTYEDAGQKYHQGMQAQQAANAEMATTAKAVVDTLGQLQDSLQAETASVVAWTNMLTLTMAICGIVLGIVLAFSITLSIVRPIRRIITSLTEGAEQVKTASVQVAAASQSLAEGATEQAAGLEETSSSLEEMASQTKRNADNAQQANSLASEAQSSAQSGTGAMGRMSTAINDIQKSSDETAKIIKVIDEIAFQTNLLALNAAVEAARAGEAGKGFAVVAEEVRNLAMRSAEAAKNTARMIEESVKNSKNGVDIANEVRKVLDEIVGSVSKTTGLVGEIAAASQEQAQGIDQVNTAVAQMDKVTQQNAANAEESASASEELSAQAESMDQAVQELVALVGGAASRNPQFSNRRPAGRASIGRMEHGPAQTLAKKKPAKLSISDKVFHRIADKGPQAASTPKVDPAEVIPLDKDEELKAFNA
jgi:methyl-accepting chemotaxis protein